MKGKLTYYKSNEFFAEKKQTSGGNHGQRIINLLKQG